MNLRKVLPGKTLEAEIKARDMNATSFARSIGVSSGRITNIINGKSKITADTALKLGEAFGNDPMFWMNLQNNYDIAVIRERQNDGT